jgi:hypothetical protein
MTEQSMRCCRRLLLFAAGWTVIGVLAVAPVSSQTQSGATTPTFEVATIKPTDPNEVRARLGVEQDRFVTVNQTLVDVIRFAYDLNSNDRRISGGSNCDVGKVRYSSESGWVACRELAEAFSAAANKRGSPDGPETSGGPVQTESAS